MSFLRKPPNDFRDLMKRDTEEKNGEKGARYLLFNAVGPDKGDTVARLNIESENSATYIFVSMCKKKPLDNDVWTTLVGYKSFLIDVTTLRHLRDNFECVRQAIGETPLGKLRSESDASRQVMSTLSQITPNIVEIDRILRERSVNTPLSRAYLEAIKPDLTGSADELAGYFEKSRKVYEQLPAMTANDESDRSENDPDQPAAQLRKYCSIHPSNPLNGPFRLDYVGYEYKPLNINKKFKWYDDIEKDNGPDYRVHSIDLIMAHEGQPVLVEVKMKNDKWASSAIVQLLYYASTMANKNQMRRLQESFKDKLNDDVSKMWLSIIIEDRNDNGFSDDYELAKTFLHNESIRNTLRPHFSGIYVVKIKEKEIDSHQWESISNHTCLIKWED